MLLVCRHCGAPGGCLQLVALDGASPPAAAAPAPAPPAGQRAAARRTRRLRCAARAECRLGVNRRRDGSWFPTLHTLRVEVGTDDHSRPVTLEAAAGASPDR